MKAVKIALLGLSLISTTCTVGAEEYMFTYSKLYSQLKNNAKEGHDNVKVGLFFVDAKTNQLCKVEKAWMEKEQHYEQLKMTQQNEVLIPVDKNLKSANPLIFIHTPDDKRCDFSMVVMAKEPLVGKVTYSQVEQLIPEMTQMLNDLGGMFSSWFSPSVEGLTLEFSDIHTGTINLSSGKVVPINNGKAQVLIEEIGKGGFMTLPHATARVLPFIPK